MVVSLNADNDLPRLDPEARRRLLEPIETALWAATDNARLGISVVPGEVVASIICDGDAGGVQPRAGDARDPRIEVTDIGDTVWVSVHHQIPVTQQCAEESADIA